MGAMAWALDMANFENVPVQLQGFEMENVTMLWSVFMNEVLRLIKVHRSAALAAWLHLQLCW